MPTMIAKPITADYEGRTASPPLWPKSENLIRDPLLQGVAEGTI